MTKRKRAPTGYSGLGLGHLGTLSDHHSAVHAPPAEGVAPTPKPRRTGRSVADKGKRGERQVRDLWRKYGYPDAYRQPGSGAIRRYQGDGPILPGDIAGVEPWGPVEVKWVARISQPGRGTWSGHAYMRKVLRELEGTWRQATGIGMAALLPVAFGRGDTTHGVGIEQAWRVFVPEPVLRHYLTGADFLVPVNGVWVEVSVVEFFTGVGSVDAVW